MTVHFGLKFENKIPGNMLYEGKNVRKEADNLAASLNRMVPSDDITLEVKPSGADTPEKVEQTMAEVDESIKSGCATTPDPAKPGYPFMLLYTFKADGRQMGKTDGWASELFNNIGYYGTRQDLAGKLLQEMFPFFDKQEATP